VCTSDATVHIPFSSFLFFPPCLSASRYLVRFAWSTLPLSRANICRYTLKRSETKRRRDTLAKFGIFTNLSSVNIRLLVCQERLCSPRFPPSRASFVFYRRFLWLLLVEFLRVWYQCFPVAIIYLVKRLLTKGEVNPRIFLFSYLSLSLSLSRLSKYKDYFISSDSWNFQEIVTIATWQN